MHNLWESVFKWSPVRVIISDGLLFSKYGLSKLEYALCLVSLKIFIPQEDVS